MKAKRVVRHKTLAAHLQSAQKLKAASRKTGKTGIGIRPATTIRNEKGATS